MKKILILVPVLWITFSCKNEAKKTENATDSVAEQTKMAMRSADSLTLDEFNQIKDTPEKIEWLQINGNLVYRNDLNKYFIDNHLVNNEDPIVENFNTAIKTNIRWATVQETFGTFMFEKFVKFNKNNRTLELALSDNFDENGLNYCIPLFRAIENKYNLSEESILEVAKFRVANTDVIAFKIQGEREVYDYSKIP